LEVAPRRFWSLGVPPLSCAHPGPPTPPKQADPSLGWQRLRRLRYAIKCRCVRLIRVLELTKQNTRREQGQGARVWSFASLYNGVHEGGRASALCHRRSTQPLC
jgi:hypothetical protein